MKMAKFTATKKESMVIRRIAERAIDLLKHKDNPSRPPPGG